VRVLAFGPMPSDLPPEVLAAAGLEVEAAPQPQPDEIGATAELAAALRAGEHALGGGDVACAIVGGAGDDALGAALAAVKLGVPTAWLAPEEPSPEARVIGRVADLAIAATDDAEDAARRIRSLAAPRLRSR
jgi:hypothetical protein